jgi:formylglycine-generating enzyme required for sulfatase activity
VRRPPAALVVLALAGALGACARDASPAATDATPWRTAWEKGRAVVVAGIESQAPVEDVRAAIDRVERAISDPAWEADPAAAEDVAAWREAVAALRDEVRAREALGEGAPELALALVEKSLSRRGGTEADAARRREVKRLATQKRGSREAGSPAVPGIVFVRVREGRYRVGTPPSSTPPEGFHDPEEGRDEELEIPPLDVPVREFWISRTEVTREAWREHGGAALPGASPSRSPASASAAELAARSGEGWLPAWGMTYAQAVAFCRGLSRVDRDFTFRLPTEVEWEVACRAGTNPAETPFPLGKRGDEGKPGNWPHLLETYAVHSAARYSGAGLDDPLPVASRAPNPWGLYDMLGNVEEWCTRSSPPFPYGPERDPPMQPIRGGAFSSEYAACRAGSRRLQPEGKGGQTIGVRVVAVGAK